MAQYPSSSDIYIELNGRRMAVVQSYRAKAQRQSQYVEAFGAVEPVGTVGGRVNHYLQLSRVCLSGSALDDGISFYDLTDFNLVIVKQQHRILYSGCQWATIEEHATLGSVVLEQVAIVAAARLEMDL